MSKQNLTQIVGVWLVMVISALVITQAQDSIPLQADDPITVTIGESPAWLSYDGTAGDSISITTLTAVTDTAPDTTIEILYPDGQRLDYNDDTILPDGNLKSDAQLLKLELPVDGTYQIRIDSFNGVSEGEVDVLLTSPTVSLDVLETDTLTIVRGDIPAGDSLRYEIDLSADTTVSVTVRDVSGTLDPVLSIYDGDTLLSFNDDHSSDDLTLDVLDAQVNNITLAEDTTLTIDVRDYLGRSGTVELIINTVNDD